VKLSADFLLHNKTEMKIEEYGDDARQTTASLSLSLNSMVLFIGSWSLMILNWVFFTQKPIASFPVWCRLGGSV
jgi:hypothetical protein